MRCEGNAYGFTDENVLRERSETFNREMYAQMASRVLTSPEYVDKLVRADRTLAEKLRNRIADVIETLRSVTSKDIEIRKQLRRATKAQGLFERALGAGEKETLTNMNGENVHVGEGNEFAFVGTSKDGKRIYKSDFGENIQEEERVRKFKERIRAIFELGAVELKTDTKKIKVSADRFTAKKNLHGDEASQPDEMSAKISALYDLVDILETARYVSKSVEESYADPQQPPKNAAHKNVKYWYKFKNEIVFDGVPYTVTFNIRDKGKEQYAYLIDFHKKSETSDHNDTAQKSFAPAGQTSHTTIISQNKKMSTPKSDFSMENVSEEADQQTSGDLAFGAEDLYPGWGEEILPTREHSQEAGGWTADGIETYKTGQSVAGMSFADKVKKFENDFLQQFRGRTAKFERNGHTYYARFVESKKGLGKFIYEGTDPRSQSDETGYRAKIRLLAEGDIFSIVEDGEYKKSGKERGKQTQAHKNAKYWDYFWKEIFVDGKGYDVIINIRNDSKTNDLEDKTQFVYSMSFVENKKRATPVTTPASQKMVGVNLAIALDNNSIPQNPEMSTPKSDFSMENVSKEADQQTSGDLAFGAEDLYPGWGEEILPTREHSREAGYEVSSSRR